MINWKLGTKLVCIKSFRGVNKFGKPISFVPPRKDVIYTYAGLKGYDDTFSCWYIHLEEYPSHGTFNASHFKPLRQVLDKQSEELLSEISEEIEQEQLLEYEKQPLDNNY
jgi:hypothetical protein